MFFSFCWKQVLRTGFKIEPNRYEGNGDQRNNQSSVQNEKKMTMIERILLNKNCVTDTRLSSELVQYLNSSRVENKPGFDVIAWWSKSNFKYLDRIARDYLSVSPTSVPSEQTFSAAGLTIT
ncbi:zinc finger BED domain-containing DAYSLEEPER [Brachionus plicatilis]|uniref:Zinc finger BED domain-containing DAYSLEEPER n=1 Tax=Brachionus plicatilis TaxID=10195 RepID=A0A3M7SAU4_BRAPC|nr:zinc finger BED domain-containing DAYSLEEPER [Brachionus plicatilis]